MGNKIICIYNSYKFAAALAIMYSVYIAKPMQRHADT